MKGIALLGLVLLFSACSLLDNGRNGLFGGSGDVVEPSIIAVSSLVAQELINDVLIIDVRTAVEFRAGHIYGSVLIPYNMIDRYALKILQDKSRPVLVYCQTGRRSLVAANALKEMGVVTIYNLYRGINGWCGPLVSY